MKIIFLCSSLESGRDGVGDYARFLAGSMILLGHPAALLAINDQHIHHQSAGTQTAGEIPVPVYRLPAAWPENRRFSEAKKWIDQMDPEWISLQYVPFSFHQKGLPFGLGKKLLQLGHGRHWHIMFHELWVGMNKEANRKIIWWGEIQKRMIKSMINMIKPKVISTQTAVYMEQLHALGFKSQYLPLFTNIPSNDKEADIKLPIKKNSAEKIDFVFFGAIHPEVPVCDFAKELSHFSKANKIPVSLYIIGRSGGQKDYWSELFMNEGIPVQVFGEKPPEYISEILCKSAIGLSTTPAMLAEKSGSIAAMSRHGLPVICISRSWNPRGLKEIKPLPGVFEYRKGNLENYFEFARYPLKTYEVKDVSKMFAKSLQSAG